MVLNAMTQINAPKLFQKLLPHKTELDHKYSHGYALIYGASKLTGATRLAADACARMGAGLTSVLAPDDTSAQIYRTSLPPHMMVLTPEDGENNRHITARLYGPGGLPRNTKIRANTSVVLDADAIHHCPETTQNPVILTPHEGEFAKAFPQITGTPEQRAQQASQKTGAYIVLKGARTIIAAPTGALIINDHASPHLATAGSGDVLAGMITGLLARNMPPLHACCASVWMHGQAGIDCGLGLVASDIPALIPRIWENLLPPS